MSLPNESCLQVKFLSEHAKMPTRGSPQSAGFDLSSAEKTVVPAGGRAVVKTDLSIACPEGTYARIAPRSGLAVKKMIDCGAGVVDADYRGNVGVVLFNFGPEDFEVSVGDRIAQLMLEQISMVPAVKVEELTETHRGEGGFGSTGVSSGEKEEHTLEKRPPFTGIWDSRKNTWRKVRSKYLKAKCSYCKFECRTFCSCNRKVSMCMNCWGDHKRMC